MVIFGNMLRTLVRAERATLLVSSGLSLFRLEALSASISHPEGPHSARTAAEARQLSPSNITVAMWIIRLHLAQYCITGRYPSWVHRFSGLQLERTAKKIRHPPTSYRIVGMIIGVQAASCLVRTVANFTTTLAADYLERRTLKTLSSASPLPSLFNSSDSSQRQNKQGSQGSFTANSLGATRASTCAICRLERSHPAAPSSCGHVFCWNCLIQWVSTVRPECPLCRSPCRPQDMIALHNYSIP